MKEKKLKQDTGQKLSQTQMKWIGLTGGIASGKSSVAEILRKLGYKVADADQIAHKVVVKDSEGLRQIVQAFGEKILNLDQSLNRKALGNLVFGQAPNLEKLEKILHPLIQAETALQRQAWKNAGEKIAFYDVPLLFEKNLEANFDGILLISTDEKTQKQRMKKRDQLSDSEIINRLNSQLAMTEKIKKSTWVIKNSGSLEELESQVKKILLQIQSGTAKTN